MGTKLTRRMVTLVIALAMIMASSAFAFAAGSPSGGSTTTTGKITSMTSSVSNGGKTVTVSWTCSKKATKYRVSVGYNVKYVSGKTSAVFTGLTPGKQYKVIVSPIFGTKYGTSKSHYRFTRTISGVKATGGKGKVTLTWNKASGATTYRIYQYKNGKYVWVKTYKGTATKAVISGLAKGKTYYFKVRPYKGSYSGAFSGYRSGKVK